MLWLQKVDEESLVLNYALGRMREYGEEIECYKMYILSPQRVPLSAFVLSPELGVQIVTINNGAKLFLLILLC